MGLNKPSGEMYPWAWTWNPLRGPCLYRCKYCYVSNKIAPWLKRMGNDKYVGQICLDLNELKTPLIKPSDGKAIFVQSNGDLFGYWVSIFDIHDVFAHCRVYPQNRYLFQTKNPARFIEIPWSSYPPDTILGTTIESNRDYGLTKAPEPLKRYNSFYEVSNEMKSFFDWMVSIEPVLDFDLDIMVKWMFNLAPDFISMGANTSRCKLPEPSKEKLESLIEELRKFTEVRLKKNLNRLLKEEE